MKAWIVTPKGDYYSEIIFAETRGGAKSFALDFLEDCSFTDIRVRRAPNADKYYKEGKSYLDWYNPEDRIALVKDCGFTCHYEYFDFDECEECPAKIYCDLYKDKLRESEDEQ